jgi:hypothetical protein
MKLPVKILETLPDRRPGQTEGFYLLVSTWLEHDVADVPDELLCQQEWLVKRETLRN